MRTELAQPSAFVRACGRLRFAIQNPLAMLLTAMLGVGTGAAHANPPPAEAFGSLPAETDVTLSPDGHWLAWVDHKESKARIVIIDVLARKPQRIMAVPERAKLRALAWNDSDTLLVGLSQTVESAVATETSQEYFLTTAFSVNGGDGTMLPTSVGRAKGANAAVLARLIRVRTTKPHTVIMATSVGCNCLIEVDSLTGKAEVIKVGATHTVGWVVDRNGKPVAREDWDWVSRAYRVYALFGNSIKELLRTDDKEAPTVVGLVPDESALVLLATNGHPHQGAWAVPLDGSPMRLLSEDPDLDVEGTITDPYNGAIIGVFVSGLETRVHWLDPAPQRRFDTLQRAFPNRAVWIRDWTADGSKTLVEVSAAAIPPVYYLVDFTSHRADIAAEEYPALSNMQFGELQSITYKARDGTAIPAYLTTPVGKAAPGPLVVLPHGGPQARDYPNFDFIVQFLASRGYAVLQPQFRGSTGFGDAFREAGYRQWGGLMQDDVTDGVNAMIAQGIADPKRVCIVGLSYGGYAALAGAAFTPNLYACAASVNGVTDLPKLMQEKVPMYLGFGGRIISTTQAQWKERVGGPGDFSLAAKSPINAVSAIKIPVLIMYGSGDGIVPNEQSERMAHALSTAGKTVTLVKLPDEDHWLSHTETRVDMLKGLDSFLHDHL
jgi:dipeptidyl aminopeptidase/acylaminoacyl peptidase